MPIMPIMPIMHYAERFSVFDNALGKTYKEIDETLYGTISDPERATMFVVRQLYDHFFQVLAPDEEVRASKYWRNKKPEKDRDPKAI